MPPLNGIDRGIDGTMLKALEEIGHGAQIVVVDPSYDIPVGAEVVSYHGNSTAQALRGILKLVPNDDDSINAMAPDEFEDPAEALDLAKEVAEEFGIDIFAVRRFPEPESENTRNRAGFYELANHSLEHEHTLFVRTRDPRPYACAMFIVGHSQE